MQISAEGKIGIALALVGLGGAGAIMIALNQVWIGWTMIAVAAIGGGLLTLHHFRFERREAFSTLSYPLLTYLSARDSQLESAIISMAHNSAWGRWFSAQHLANSGVPVGLQYLYQIAAGEVMKEITNGNLEVRGRRPDPKRLEYETIDRTHWRSSCFLCVADPISLWKIRLCPKGIFEIEPDGTVRAKDITAAQRTSLLDYDSFIIDAYQFEKLWPKTDALADKKRRQFLRLARRRDLNVDEIRRLSK
jgi:hypothetical protein